MACPFMAMAKMPGSMDVSRAVSPALSEDTSTSYLQNNATTNLTGDHQSNQEAASSKQQAANVTSAAARSQGETSTSGALNNFPARSAAGTMQAWDLTRPVLEHCPMLTRRELRRMNKAWTLEEVAQHRYKDDGWIAVGGNVYDITGHVVEHPGWDSGCGISTVLSILSSLGTECTQEFTEIHRSYPIAWRQLRAYYIGQLADSTTSTSDGNGDGSSGNRGAEQQRMEGLELEGHQQRGAEQQSTEVLEGHQQQREAFASSASSANLASGA